MKKTLTLLALLGTLATTSLSAKEVWWKGITPDTENRTMAGAITTYKYNPYAGGADSDMCWVASACNVIAWWQDRVEENGALIIPEGTPRDYKIYDVERTLWKNVGGYQGNAIQMWMTGGSKLCLSTADAPQEGLDFAGYYPRLAGACLGIYNYSNSKGVNPETAARFPNDYSHYEYTMIQTQWYRPSSQSYSNPELNNYDRASEQMVNYLKDGWGVVWSTTKHAMTSYGVEVDENGKIVKLFNSDNNVNIGYGKYSELNVWSSDNGDGSVKVKTSWGGGYQIDDIVAVRTTGIRFLDYDVRVGKNIEGEDEAVFSHYCNLIVDGADDFQLKYDLRDASVEGSPVDALKVEQYSPDDGLSYLERYSDEEVPTGDMHFKGGKVTLVEGVGKYDSGGSVEGTIFFKESAVQDTGRTLVVDRTDTIAKEINLSATSGSNTLEVTENHTATFETLSGKGDLDKTGAGTAEVTGDVTLEGDIRVHEGSFIFGKDATISETTSLTVSEGARVQGAEGKAITLTIDSGVHVNDGVMTLTTTVNEGATLKGSGTFAGVTMNGGTLIVGNSPGQQTYTGDLTVNLGDIVFSVDGWNAADEDSAGWGNGVYSNINMGNNAFTVGNDGNIIIALSDEASQALTMGTGELDLTLISNMGNTLSEDELQGLMQRTSFMLSGEQKEALDTPLALDLSKAAYMMRDNALILTSLAGTDNPVPPAPVPEPATGTLSLLALAGLCARRRRK